MVVLLSSSPFPRQEAGAPRGILSFSRSPATQRRLARRAALQQSSWAAVFCALFFIISQNVSGDFYL